MFFHCLLPRARELENKFPLTIYCHVQLETASAWDLSKQLRAPEGKDCCLPVALTSLCSLSAETSTMQLVDLSPEGISCPLTSELPVIHQHNPRQKFNIKNG